uniref:Coiled-coil domain containing 62 n=1 Tax=Leptobrachium leishanense TaxID=445787 RepID=A0A8C5LWX3_9ANUR
MLKSTSPMNSSLPHTTSPKLPSADLEQSTIQKQRNELQLLIAELKDRDKELNDMVSVHQKQLLAWENDRQRILTLEQKCNRLENELQKRNEIIRSLTKRIKLIENQQQDRTTTLESTQQQLQELLFKASEAATQCQDLEERNQSLHDTVMELSAQAGRLQAREEELTTLLKLKDNDIIEATNHITEFTSRFKDLEAALRETRNREAASIKEVQDLKPRLKGLKREIDKLKAEREKRKEQLILLAKSKQDRTDTELQNLRQIYMKQHHDLQFLHLTLDSSQDMTKEQEQSDGASDCPLDLKALSLGSPGRDKTEKLQNIHENFLSGLKSPLMQSSLKDSTHQKYQKSTTPTLQRLLAESRQMVADLELSMLLPGLHDGLNNPNDPSQPEMEISQEIHLQDLKNENNTGGCCS